MALNSAHCDSTSGALYTRGGGYAGIMVTRPQTIGYSLTFNAVDQKTVQIKIPVGITVFPGEIYQAPRS